MSLFLASGPEASAGQQHQERNTAVPGGLRHGQTVGNFGRFGFSMLLLWFLFVFKSSTFTMFKRGSMYIFQPPPPLWEKIGMTKDAKMCKQKKEILCHLCTLVVKVSDI